MDNKNKSIASRVPTTKEVNAPKKNGTLSTLRRGILDAKDTLLTIAVVGFIAVTVLAFLKPDKFGSPYFTITSQIFTAVIALSKPPTMKPDKDDDPDD